MRGFMTRNSSSAVPWVRLAVEATAIVGSILIAFAIDAWWQERQEDKAAREILVSLQEEFTFHRATLVRDKALWAGNEASVSRLLQLFKSGEIPKPAVMDTLLLDLTWMHTWDPGSGAHDALIASGSLELIENLGLRNNLSEWQSRVDEVRDNELIAREMNLKVIMPYLAERGFPFGRASGIIGETWPAPVASDAEAARVNRILLSDPVFAGHVALRYIWFDQVEYSDAIALADSILVAIESELRQ